MISFLVLNLAGLADAVATGSWRLRSHAYSFAMIAAGALGVFPPVKLILRENLRPAASLPSECGNNA
jgi:hypothetical protein